MSTAPVNKAEEFVLGVCQRSFLSLWCYNNPKGKDNDELCDVLVVCDPYVIIVSVKEIQLKDEPTQVHHERWTRKAVEASVNQIYGADRWLASAPHVIRSDGTPGLALPPLDRRKVHRIAVALGSRGEVSIQSGDFGKGHVHVMTEESFQDILNELDTVTDMVAYLGAKEAFSARCSTVMQGTEKDLLGWYLFQGRTFPEEADFMLVMDDIWDGLRERAEYKLRKEADKESYVWDTLIDLLSDPEAKPVGETGVELTEFEVALRVMARESRFARRILGRSVREFFEQAKANRLRSRIMFSSTSTVLYVVVYFGAAEDDRSRIAELGTRCLIARQKVGRGNSVIGIGIGQFLPGRGSTSDLIYLDTSHWSAEDEEHALQMQGDLGYYANSPLHHAHEDEYPGSE
jgi:hypothetical protein